MESGQESLEDIKEALQNAKVWAPIIFIPSDHISLNPEGCYNVGVTRTSCSQLQTRYSRLCRSGTWASVHDPRRTHLATKIFFILHLDLNFFLHDT